MVWQPNYLAQITRKVFKKNVNSIITPTHIKLVKILDTIWIFLSNKSKFSKHMKLLFDHSYCKCWVNVLEACIVLRHCLFWLLAIFFWSKHEVQPVLSLPYWCFNGFINNTTYAQIITYPCTVTEGLWKGEWRNVLKKNTKKPKHKKQTQIIGRPISYTVMYAKSYRNQFTTFKIVSVHLAGKLLSTLFNSAIFPTHCRKHLLSNVKKYIFNKISLIFSSGKAIYYAINPQKLRN